MKIVMMNGGLGNQTFQYIFLRYIELVSGEDCYVDDSPFFVAEPPHNGYELDRVFGTCAKRLSDFVGPRIWRDMLKTRDGGRSIPQQLSDSGLPLTLIAECANFRFGGEVVYAPKNAFSPWVAAKGNVYYHGYWMHEGWLNAYRDVLLSELKFPEISDCENLALRRQIENSDSVGYTCAAATSCRKAAPFPPDTIAIPSCTSRAGADARSILSFPTISYGVSETDVRWALIW